MSKKIIIDYSAQPTVGQAFDYMIQVGGLNVVYPNGLDRVDFDYEIYAGVDPDKVNIQATLSTTINETIAFLVANYSIPGITYEKVNSTIEVNINLEGHILVSIFGINPSITIDTEDISNITYVNLKYFFQYKNIVGDTYLCEIFKKNYTGAYQEINGIAILEKASVTNHLDPIRGGGVQLQLEATKDLTLEDLYSESEQDFSVKLYKNDNVIFRGFLNPDGVYQDYVKDEWRINLDCVDGLGSLSNLSFVQDNGLHFIGKMTAQDIVYQCLKRTGILMPINTSINILYEGLTSSDDILKNIYLNTDRFYKSDGLSTKDSTLMSCEEVLRSVLDIFKACVTQIDGEWYIYKPNEIYIQPYVMFRRFDLDNHYIGNKTINLNKSLGSQIDGFYPHHCTGNQRIEIKGSISGFRLGYKYGYVSGLLENGDLYHNSNLEYDGWNISPTGETYLINDPLDVTGLRTHINYSFGNILLATSNPVSLIEGDSFKLNVTLKSNGLSHFVVVVKIGSYFMNGAGQWVTSGIGSITFQLSGNSDGATISKSFEIQSQPLPISGNVEVLLYVPTADISIPTNKIDATNGEYESVQLEPTADGSAIQGEFHTVERGNRPSSIVKPNQTVYNGDNPSQVYNGTIFKEDALNPTELWYRVNSALKQPLLQIAAEEELRIAQRPTKVFRGDFYGFIPYLSLVTINNVGQFMFTEWSYNTSTNITTAKHLELFAAELFNIEYKYSIDYGNTVKPTIK